MLHASPCARAQPDARAAANLLVKTMDARVRKVIELMRSGFHRPVDIDELARSVNLTPSRLRHLFKAETGAPPARYLRTLRMRKAESLLAGTFMRVKEIASVVGAKDESHFMRDFKKLYGLTPSQYRATVHAPDAERAREVAKSASG